MLVKYFSQQNLMQIHLIFWCTCNYYDFTKPINSKFCSICHRLAVIWKGSFGGFPIWDSSGVGSCANWKNTHDFPIPLNTHFALSPIWLEFQCQNMAPQFYPLIGGLGGPRGSKMVPIERSFPHSYSTSIHTTGLSYTVWPEYIERQTDDREIGIASAA